jgi:hypothetical protein
LHGPAALLARDALGSAGIGSAHWAIARLTGIREPLLVLEGPRVVFVIDEFNWFG